jgi:hypothetical protein
LLKIIKILASLTNLIPIDPDKVNFFQIDHGVAEIIVPSVMASRTFTSLSKVPMHDGLKNRRKWRHTNSSRDLESRNYILGRNTS